MIEFRNTKRKNILKYVDCRKCAKKIPNNRTKQCNRYSNQTITRNNEGRNNNESSQEIQIIREQVGNTLKYNKQINKRNYDLINQGYIESTKENESMRILAINP